MCHVLKETMTEDEGKWAGREKNVEYYCNKGENVTLQTLKLSESVHLGKWKYCKGGGAVGDFASILAVK